MTINTPMLSHEIAIDQNNIPFVREQPTLHQPDKKKSHGGVALTWFDVWYGIYTSGAGLAGLGALIAKALGVTAAVGAGTAVAAAAIPKIKDAIDDARSRTPTSTKTVTQTKTAVLPPPPGSCS